MSGANASDLLNQLEHILDSDPLIDEVGFIHPSQFAALIEEAGNQSADKIMGSEGSKANMSDLVFWSRDHKLGISTSVLLPLYNAAKYAFMEALKQYKQLNELHGQSNISEDDATICPSSSLSITETETMKHSRALLLVSCDFGTAWNFRKLIVSGKQQLHVIMDELLLSTLILSYSPKSERAWSHRRWAIKMIAGMFPNLEEIVERESEFVEKIAEKSKMNYRAWNHRCWLVSYMSGKQMVHELNKSQDWAGLHAADNSCFHYRARLLLKIVESASHKQHSDVCAYAELHELWKKELDWVETLIRRYVGREALWLHRRFLSLCWINHCTTHVHQNSSHCCSKDVSNVQIFTENELQLCHSCLLIPDNEFEDHQAQATFAATYIMWLIMVNGSLGIELQKKLEASGLKTVLNQFYPEKSFLWDTLTAKALLKTREFNTKNSHM